MLPPVGQWAAHLPEGAFVEFESRAFIIPNGEHRGTKLLQLRSLGTLVKQVLAQWSLTDDNKYSATHGKLITWPMVNMCAHSRYLVRAVIMILLCVRCAYDLGLFQVPHM